MSTPEEILVNEAVQGDRDALTRLIQLHGPALRERFRSEIPRRWQSVLALDDLMQETYTDVFLDIAGFTSQGYGAFSAWLTTIARNNLLNAIAMLEAEKRGGNHRRLEPQADESYLELYEMVGGTTTTPSRVAARQEAKIALESALAKLPPDYQRVVQLYDLEGKSVEVVSAALGRSPGAVFMLRARAHRALANFLGTAARYLSESA